ncbi:PREDICTED: uncharacterized protein LOC106909103 [Poecilia mexicana]|uniref:uncharacterized protein LOC106909103 n=1 Tax=Poecilia mexicana TaxID=48701 RepID=UPI00072DF93B|nr:PREDICTED: uncharacterized protein LOC106909103 [Poecilia mexicana]
MFSLKQAALLFIQLLLTNYISARIATADHYDVLVSRGNSVLLTCNMSNENATIIQWTKDRWVFKYSFSRNQTFSNFSSHRLRIDTNIPSTLSIDSAQHDDAGLYTCNIIGNKGLNNITWTVTVLENQNGTSSSQYIIFTLPSAFGLILCFMTTALCLHRRSRLYGASLWLLFNGSRRNMSRNQNQDSRTFTTVQYNIMDGTKAVPSPFQTTAIWRRTDKQEGGAVLMTRRTTSTSHHSGND